MPVLTYHEAKQKLAKGDFPRYLLLQGEERFLGRELIADLRRCIGERAGSLDYVEWDGSAVEAEVCQMLVTIPLGGGKRLAVIHNPTSDALTNYLRIAGPHLVLVLHQETKPKTSSKAYRFLADKGWVVDCSPLRGRELTRWAVGEARSRHREISPSALEYLRFLCGDNPAQIRQEIEKASLYLGPEAKAITVEVLKEVGSRTAGRSIFELVDAVAERKTELVAEALAEISAQGQPPVLVLTFLSLHFLLLLETACLLEEGVLPQKIPEVMGVQPFVAKKMLQQLGSFSIAGLEKTLDVLLNLDVALKQGRGNPQLLLEVALMEICLKNPLALQGKGVRKIR